MFCPGALAEIKCGDNDAIANRIVGGDEVVRHSIPWQAALVNKKGFYKDRPFCGGTIIDSTHILTAAHCTEGQNVNRLRVNKADLAPITPKYFWPNPLSQNEIFV